MAAIARAQNARLIQALGDRVCLCSSPAPCEDVTDHLLLRYSRKCFHRVKLLRLAPFRIRVVLVNVDIGISSLAAVKLAHFESLPASVQIPAPQPPPFDTRPAIGRDALVVA